jgi:mono/diheme cytochrome c family protein
MLAVLALVLILSLSGCGEAPTPTAVHTSPTPPESTADRLAAPVLPPNPSQADLGAYTYWARCMPCHGDRGQGLTDEFRALYPPEDRNCWASGCHGPRPYENGFTLPATIPALIGPGRLESFSDAASLEAFIAAAMPFSDPGSLSQEEYWQVTAFLLRENRRDPGTATLGPENAGQFILRPEPGASPPSPTGLPTPTPSSSSPGEPLERYRGAVVAIAFLLMIAWWLRFEHQRKDAAKKK